MNVHQIDKITKYVRYLQENPNEIEILFKEILIGVTNFFRDSAVWDKLRDKILPDLFKNSKMDMYIGHGSPVVRRERRLIHLRLYLKKHLKRKRVVKIFIFRFLLLILMQMQLI